MREDFLHYLWKRQRFDPQYMISTAGDPFYVVNPGQHNLLEGPDFLNAHIKMDALDWHGSIEFHIKSSDWYAHRHHLDSTYNNVILHLVWEDDVSVFTQKGAEVYTLCIKSWISQKELDLFTEFFKQTKEEIVCAKRFSTVDSIIHLGWRERLYVGRLERRVEEIEKHWVQAKKDWEAVFFWYLAKGFGLNHNGLAFFEVAKSLPFSVVRKFSHKVEDLEALFMGQSGLLEKEISDSYFQKLKRVYAYQKHKFKLKPTAGNVPHFARIRPANFPTLRWAQLAKIYVENKALFTTLMQSNSIQKCSSWLTLGVSPYWEDHYNFGKTSPKRIKKITSSFMQLMEINVVLPFHYFYHQSKGINTSNAVMLRMSQLPPEKNNISQYFKSIGGKVESALDSQAYISLKKEYCDLKKCLLCAVGQSLLQQKNGTT